MEWVPQKQFNWSLSTSQEQLSSSRFPAGFQAEPCSVQSSMRFSPQHWAVLLSLAPKQGALPEGAQSWVCQVAPSWPRAVLSEVLSFPPSHSPWPYCCAMQPQHRMCADGDTEPGWVPELGLGLLWALCLTPGAPSSACPDCPLALAAPQSILCAFLHKINTMSLRSALLSWMITSVVSSDSWLKDSIYQTPWLWLLSVVGAGAEHPLRSQPCWLYPCAVVGYPTSIMSSFLSIEGNVSSIFFPNFPSS